MNTTNMIKPFSEAKAGNFEGQNVVGENIVGTQTEIKSNFNQPTSELTITAPSAEGQSTTTKTKPQDALGMKTETELAQAVQSATTEGATAGDDIMSFDLKDASVALANDFVARLIARRADVEKEQA